METNRNYQSRIKVNSKERKEECTFEEDNKRMKLKRDEKGKEQETEEERQGQEYHVSI